jgi:hypothetical protein
MARNQSKLIQTAIDNVMPPLPFNQIQYAEIGDWNGEAEHPGWRKIKASLADLCGPPGAAQTRSHPMPSAPPPVASAVAHIPEPTPVYTPTSLSTPTPSSATSRYLLFGGFGVLAVLLALAVGMYLGKGGSSPAAGPSDVNTLASPTAPTSGAPSASPTSAASSASADASEAQNRHVNVMNMSSQTMRELYASPVTSDTWEEDLLGTGTLAAGDSIDANIDNGTGECSYDLRAVMADGREYIQRKVDVCTVSQWMIGDTGDSTS